LIQVKNVWKIFGDRSEEALNAIRKNNLSKAEVLEQFNCVVGVANTSLDIKEGEIFCIMGLSGSGKSTLVRHFNRLLEPTAGEIIIDGIDVMQLNTPQLQKFRNERIGMVFQNFALMPHRSVLDNVAMPLEIRGVGKNERLQQASEVLEIVELGAWGNKFAHELSGGMQQRVGLARAISANPDVLLMDEPFSALDPLIRRQLQDEFIKLSKQLQKTTVFITGSDWYGRRDCDEPTDRICGKLCRGDLAFKSCESARNYEAKRCRSFAQIRISNVDSKTRRYLCG